MVDLKKKKKKFTLNGSEASVILFVKNSKLNKNKKILCGRSAQRRHRTTTKFEICTYRSIYEINHKKKIISHSTEVKRLSYDNL